jgi:hypothetical protein
VGVPACALEKNTGLEISTNLQVSISQDYEEWSLVSRRLYVFMFGIQGLIHPRSVPDESEHSSSKNRGPSNGSQNKIEILPKTILTIRFLVIYEGHRSK